MIDFELTDEQRLIRDTARVRRHGERELVRKLIIGRAVTGVNAIT